MFLRSATLLGEAGNNCTNILYAGKDTSGAWKTHLDGFRMML